MNTSSIGLADLVAPLSVDAFVTSYWRKRAYHRAAACSAVVRRQGEIVPEKIARETGSLDAVLVVCRALEARGALRITSRVK